MKNMPRTFILIMLAVSTCFAFAQDTSKKSDFEYQEKFEATMLQLYREYNLQGDLLIGAVNEQGLFYSYALNKHIAHNHAHNQTATLNNDTPFYIASHTKALTGTLLKILEEEGKVDLDKSLHDYLPDVITNNKIDAKSVSVRQLLNHTAGFTSMMHTAKTSFLGAKEHTKEFVEALNTNVLTAPRGKFRYSNTGPIIAGMIVEKVTGNSWQQEMQQRIFAPLHMSTTSSKVSDYPDNTILPSIDSTRDNTIFRAGFYKNDQTMHAAGGTISTVNDLAKWLQFNINQETSIVKDRASFAELHHSTVDQNRKFFTYKRNGYSLGWDIATYNDELILTRFGGLGGISFHASFIPSKKVGVIAFFNEKRGNRLPHLAANYLYNLVDGSSQADGMFEAEKQLFDKGYSQHNKRALSESMLLKPSDSNDKLVGVFTTDSGWPEIRIEKTATNYSFNWGMQSGPIVSTNNPQKPLLAALGPMNRTFRVERHNGEITALVNGRITFTKKN